MLIDVGAAGPSDDVGLGGSLFQREEGKLLVEPGREPYLASNRKTHGSVARVDDM